MNLEELQHIIEKEVGVLLYFSGEHCNVCHALRPKVKELFEREFPNIRQVFLDAHEHMEIASHFVVLSFPVMIVFLDGREFMREGRTVSLHQLREKLHRPYGIMVS